MFFLYLRERKFRAGLMVISFPFSQRRAPARIAKGGEIMPVCPNTRKRKKCRHPFHNKTMSFPPKPERFKTHLLHQADRKDKNNSL